jgi:hypothetical protein
LVIALTALNENVCHKVDPLFLPSPFSPFASFTRLDAGDKEVSQEKKGSVDRLANADYREPQGKAEITVFTC